MNLHFDLLKFIFQNNSTLGYVCRYSIGFISRYMLASSAYNFIKDVQTSFMYNTNKHGPITEHCGTGDVTGKVVDTLPSIITDSYRSC